MPTRLTVTSKVGLPSPTSRPDIFWQSLSAPSIQTATFMFVPLTKAVALLRIRANHSQGYVVGKTLIDSTRSRINAIGVGALEPNIDLQNYAIVVNMCGKRRWIFHGASKFLPLFVAAQLPPFWSTYVVPEQMLIRCDLCTRSVGNRRPAHNAILPRVRIVARSGGPRGSMTTFNVSLPERQPSRCRCACCAQPYRSAAAHSRLQK